MAISIADKSVSLPLVTSMPQGLNNSWVYAMLDDLLLTLDLKE